MRKRYAAQNLLFVSVAVVLFAITSCKKDKTTTKTTTTATPTKLGLYEESETTDTAVYREIFITVSQIGTQTISSSYNDLVFDTGSGGMVIDAHGILPASMITSTGFNFTGDSTVVDGITITNQHGTIGYGDDANSSATVYGNLCYASVTIGETDGNIVVKRLPFFMYYKSVDGSGNAYPVHEFDVFGVNAENDVTFANGVAITSPFSYFDPGTGLTKGFKLAALGTSNFTDANEVPITPNVVTLGLTSDDLSSSSGFTISQLSYYNGDGYPPIIPATLNYGGSNVTAEVLFDTGTDPYTYLEDPKAARTVTQLPSGTSVKITGTSTAAGFSYNYTTTPTENLTYLENPNTSTVPITIVSLEFFLTNEYMLDFTDHKIGLKAN